MQRGNFDHLTRDSVCVSVLVVHQCVTSARMQSSRREKYFQQEEISITGENIASLDDYMNQVLKYLIPNNV